MNGIKIFAFADEASNELNGQICAMKRNALDGIEIRNVDGENISDISTQKAKEIKEKLDSAGLYVWSLGSPIGKIDIVNDDFCAHTEKLKRTLNTANILGAENIRIFSFYMPKDGNYDDYADTVIDRLGVISELCAKSGVYACLENEKGVYGDLPERCLKLYNELPLLCGIFDPANFVQCGVDTLSAWKMLNPYIKYLHIKDSLKNGNVVPAGKGDGNISEILASYIGMGGKCVTLEPHLAVFDGLKALERKGEESGVGNVYDFADGNEAFDTACDALKSIIKGEIG